MPKSINGVKENLNENDELQNSPLDPKSQRMNCYEIFNIYYIRRKEILIEQ